MDNYNLQWRVWAKVVAFLDLISSIALLLITVLLIFFAGAVTEAVATSDDKSMEAVVVAWYIWLIVVIVAAITVVDLWAAVKLINATELGRDANDAIRFCQYWRVVAIIFMVLNFVIHLVLAMYVTLAISLFIRGGFIFIVYRFMQELETIIGGSPRQMKQCQRF